MPASSSADMSVVAHELPHGHHGAASGDRSAAEPCGHCPDGSGCGQHVSAAATDCGTSGDALADSRQGSNKLRDLQPDLLPAICGAPPPVRASPPPAVLLPVAKAVGPAEPSLNIRFCVFLK
jgi:hypothetical protein